MKQMVHLIILGYEHGVEYIKKYIIVIQYAKFDFSLRCLGLLEMVPINAYCLDILILLPFALSSVLAQMINFILWLIFFLPDSKCSKTPLHL